MLRHSRIVVRHEVRHAGLLVVRHRAAEFFLGDLLVRHRLDDLRGPVMNMYEVFCTIRMKSVIAGE
jgi:hypothetical protein